MTAQEATELVAKKTITRLGRYLIAEELASGGMAKLYVARKEGARELCVLKRLHLELLQDEVATARFQREAHVASYLSHPNIVRTLEAGFEGGTFCIASELVSGQTLEAVIEKLRSLGRSLPPEAAISIALQLLDALGYAHSLYGEDGKPLEIVHRDLSPRNILLDFSGEVKIIDFGVARGKLDQFRTAPGVVVGSLEYMSPEQAAALPVDGRSDLYTVAVVLWEMLTGSHVVPRKAELSQKLGAIVRETLPPISSVATHLSPAFDRVLQRALAKRAEDRYPNANAFRAELGEAAVGIVVAPAPIIGMLLREIMPEEEAEMLALIERSKRVLDQAQALERTIPDLVRPNSARYEPTALVDRPRGGRARKISITAVDEPPPEGTKLGAMVLDMPGEPVPLSRTVFESLRRTNKKLYYSLVALSVVAVLLLGAVMFNALGSRSGDAGAELEPAVAGEVEPAGPGVIARSGGPEVVETAAAPSEPAARSKSERPRRRIATAAAPAEKAPEPARVAEPPPAPVEEKKVEAPYPHLRRMLLQLKSSPTRDSQTYYKLLGGLETAISELPASAQKRIQPELNAASLTYDVESLGRALEELMKARARATD